MSTAVRQLDASPFDPGLTARGAGAAGYVPGLDGLRGVAVLLVILYHFAPEVMPAGFLGVDVFFVLSGFLITRLLLDEAERRGTIRLGRFWARRARRLVPALLVTVLGTCLVAILTDLDGTFTGLARHARASLLYVVNWAFISEHSSYFASFATPSPLRHMWSLAIEEQFYLVWPVVLVVVYALAARRSARGRPGPQPVLLVGWLAAIGAVFSATLMAVLFEPGTDPSRVYYGTDTRVFGVLLGAVGAVVLLRAGSRDASEPGGGRSWARTALERSLPWLPVLGALALGAVLLAAWRLDDRSEGLYQGGLFVVSMVVLLLVVAVTAVPARGAARLLSVKLLRQVGVISYGLYLYHWPVMIYVSERTTGRSGLTLFVLRSVITLVVACVSSTS